MDRLCKKLHNDTEELIAAGTKQDSIETSTGKTHIQSAYRLCRSLAPHKKDRDFLISKTYIKENF